MLRGALAAADERGARTVAFPLVSAGIYGWPKDESIAAAIETLRSTPTSVEEARLVAFGRRRTTRSRPPCQRTSLRVTAEAGTIR